MKIPHAPVCVDLCEASYTRRYQILLTKPLRERLYDGASLILSTQAGGKQGEFRCPADELRLLAFAAELSARAAMDCPVEAVAVTSSPLPLPPARSPAA